MGWELRNSKGDRYLYRTERRDGKVVKTYVGCPSNPVAQIIGRMDRSQIALSKINHRSELAADLPEHDRLLHAFDIRSALFDKLISRAKAMKFSPNPKQAKPPNANEPSATAANSPPTRPEFLALVARAEKGSERAQADLRATLDSNPQIWKHMGDLGSLVEGFLVDLAAQKSILLRESFNRRLEESREQLCRPDTGPLERWLVHRVLVSWLEVEVRQIQAMLAHGEPMNRKQQRRLDQAQRRHVDAITALRDFQKT